MTIRRIIAVIFIFIAAAIGWMVLGMTVFVRSDMVDTRLGSRVADLCGSVLVQRTPEFSIKIPGSDFVRKILPDSNNIKVNLKLEQRRKGLIWYPVYTCGFYGEYSITNNEEVAQKIRVHFDFPSDKSTYDNFSMTINGTPINQNIDIVSGIDDIIVLKPGETGVFKVNYVSRGTERWEYIPQNGTGRIRGFNMSVVTDFTDIDFPDGTLAPSDKKLGSDGYILTWNAGDLLTSQPIGIIMPQKLNPGPLVGKITFFAPVCLLFFFVMLAAMSIVYKIEIHPMHYMFVAAGFFAFHLLFAYLVDHLNVHWSFIISAVVTVMLVSGYLRGTLGDKFPWKIACAGQMFYLLLFSYSFFLKGMTGLTVTIGAILTLAVLMRVTARTDWSEVFKLRLPGSKLLNRRPE